MNVNLIKASLTNAKLSNTLFEYCDLSGADLTGADLDSVWFQHTKIDDNTKFVAVENYQNIVHATPFIIHRIKQTHYFDKEISTWKYNWKAIEGSSDKYFFKKWELWENLENKYKLDFINIYKKRIKDFYIKNFGPDYKWEREL
ncbi:MAG: pentapeptide repeat-containing protein [Calditrichales bacterium]|nr:pentapeptide repeat-containing protein [Calditrichales bacterium]